MLVRRLSITEEFALNAIDKPRRRGRFSKGPRRARPRFSLESLEDRCLLSIADPTANAPSLGAPPAPGPNVVWVDTDAALQSAIRNLRSDQTIVIRKGTYRLSNSLNIGQTSNVKNVTIRGETDNFNDVVLVGRGMDNASYGNVPMGISVYNAQNVTIANLSIGDVYHHSIELKGEHGADAVSVHHVRLFDAGEQFLKAQPKAKGVGVSNSSVKYSVIEYTSGTPRTDHGGGTGYTQAIDVHAGKNWVVSDNLIRSIHTPDSSDHLWGPAVLFWNGSSNIVTEGNTFVNNTRAIAYGLGDGAVEGGVIRNNFILQEPGLFSSWRRDGSDGQILVWGATDTSVVHNTILTNGNSLNSIQFRFTTTGSEARNNLTDASLRSRDGASYAASGNYTAATSSMFVDAAAGDFHLVSNTATLANVIDKVAVLSTATTDWDGQTRPQGGLADIGADEYFVRATPPGDTTPPVVTSTSPGSGAKGVAIDSSVTATFSEAVQPGTIVFALRDASGRTVSATTSHNASTHATTLKPSSALAHSTTYTATLSGAKDLAGNAMATRSWSFTTAAAPAPDPSPVQSTSIWSGSPRPSGTHNDGRPIELGTRFVAAVDGTISGLRFYKADSAATTYTINLWSSSGSRLATATFSSPAGTGWREATFSSPASIKAGTTYVASYFTSLGSYAATPNYFRARYDSGPLHVPANGGVYAYGSRSAFPNQTFGANNYWVDVTFTPSEAARPNPPDESTNPGDTTPPTVISTNPVANATGVPAGASVTIAFSEALTSATVNGSTITLKDPAGRTISAAVTYSTGNRMATLTPNSPLAASTKYIVTVGGIADLAGNAMANAYSWAFTTAAAPTTPPPSSSLSDLSKLPLLGQSNIQYVGAFRVPNVWDGSDYMRVAYGGDALAFNPANNSLFLVGHPYSSAVAEIAIPSTISDSTSINNLSFASFLQPFTKIIPKIPDPDPGVFGDGGGYWKIGGLMVYDGRLIGSVHNTYDASWKARESHFALNSTDLATANVSGTFKVGDLNPGFYGGSMAVVPEEWREVLGAPALTGLGGVSIIGRTSFGPAAFGFDPDALGSAAITPATGYVYYPEGHPTIGRYEYAPGALFNMTAGGFSPVFVPETRSVLVFAKIADGPAEYQPGGPVSVNGKYTFRVYAYDALDFVAAKNGQKNPWDVVPYTHWDFRPPINGGTGSFGGAAFDPSTGRLYISEPGADAAAESSPIISVYQVTTGGASPRSTSSASAPAGQPALASAPLVTESMMVEASPAAVSPPVEAVAPKSDQPAPAPASSITARGDALLRLIAQVSSRTKIAVNQAIKPTSWFGSTLGD